MLNQESFVNCAPDCLYIFLLCTPIFANQKSEANTALVNEGESLIKVKQEHSWSSASVGLSQHPEVHITAWGRQHWARCARWLLPPVHMSACFSKYFGLTHLLPLSALCSHKRLRCEIDAQAVSLACRVRPGDFLLQSVSYGFCFHWVFILEKVRAARCLSAAAIDERTHLSDTAPTRPSQRGLWYQFLPSHMLTITVALLHVGFR